MKILLSGATGKVGQHIERLVRDDDWEDDCDNNRDGNRAQVVGRASREQFFDDDASGDVLIDFSRPELTARALEFARARRLPMVIGTTGLDEERYSRIERAGDEIAICVAANFSIGVNVLESLVAGAAVGLPSSFDVEICEAHHRWKVDAPSGTALVLGRAVAEARGRDRDGTARIRADGRRRHGEIGYQVVRGGDVAGEHSVLFLGDGERLELTHRASDRAIFARGALHAARWLVGQPPGLYSMRDVLK